MAVTQLLARGALINPQGICLQDAAGPRTYNQVKDRVGRIATRLCAGSPMGEKCAVLSENAAGAVAGLVGIQWGGAVYVPLNPKNTVQENITIAENCEVTTLFVYSGFVTQARQMQRACPLLERLICIDGAPEGIPSLY